MTHYFGIKPYHRPFILSPSHFPIARTPDVPFKYSHSRPRWNTRPISPVKSLHPLRSLQNPLSHPLCVRKMTFPFMNEDPTSNHLATVP